MLNFTSNLQFKIDSNNCSYYCLLSSVHCHMKRTKHLTESIGNLVIFLKH